MFASSFEPLRHAQARRWRRDRLMATAGLMAAMALALVMAVAPAATATATNPVWVARYDGPAHGDDYGGVAVTDGTNVYVDGLSIGTGGHYDYATVAFRADTGSKLWVTRYDGPAHGDDIAQPMALSPDGSTVYVSGWSFGNGTGFDWTTIAYSTATGQQKWI